MIRINTAIGGSDNGWGWNLGVLFDVDADSSVGMHYRSGIGYTISGNAAFTNPAAPAAPAPLVAAVNAPLADITSKVKMPRIVNLSYFRRLNSRWDVLADAQWTGWSSIEDLTFVRANGSVLQSTPDNFKDAWKLAAGAHYRPDAQWTFRGGLAFDRSPVQTAYRTHPILQREEAVRSFVVERTSPAAQRGFG